MKPTTLSCLLAALCSASCVLADALYASAVAGSITESDSTAATPIPELVDDEQPHLEVRQAVYNPAASLNPLQYPVATTQYVESTIASSTTWIEVQYTQTFASVPDQLPTAGVGTIGYGTLTKNKRDIVPRQTGSVPVTGYAQPIVLELQNVVITQPLQAVESVLILSTITIVPNLTMTAHAGNVTYNSTFSSNNGTLFNGTTSGNVTTNGTTHSTSASNLTLPASLYPPPAYNYSTATGFYF